MSLVLVLSILIRLIAMMWSVVLVWRLKDWRMGFLTLLLAFMALRQIFTLVEDTESWTTLTFSQLDEIPGFIVSWLALGAVWYLRTFIHEQGAKEITLRESERRYQDLYENAPDMFVSVDAKTGNILECNTSLTLTSGYSKEDIIGKSVLTLYVSEDKPKVFHALEEFRQTGKIRNLELHMQRRDGEIRTVVWKASAVRNEKGEILHSRSVLRDVTEEKHIHAKLAESEQLFREFAENLNNVVWMMTVDIAEILYVNSAFEKVWGISSEKLYQDPCAWLRTVHSEDRDGVRAAFLDLPRAGKFDEEYRVIRSDGTVRWIHDRGTLINDPHGKPYRIVGIAEDITERKKVAMSLRKSEERNRLALAAGAMGTFDHDVRQNVNRWSPELEHIFGLQTGTFEKTYEAFVRRIHPADREMVTCTIETAIHELTSYDFEFRILKPNSTAETWIAGRGQVIPDDHGHPARMVGVVADVTKQKNAELTARESEARYRILVESSPFCIHEINLDGVIISMNPAGLEIMGIESTEDVIGKQYLDLVEDGDRARIEHLLDLAFQGQSSAFEFWTNTHRYFQSSIIPIKNHEGTVQRTMGITQDQTDRKQMEDTLKNLIRGTASVTGGAFFEGFIEQISLALGVRFALVTELVGGQNSRVRSLGFWNGGFETSPIEYDLAGTPCEVVIREGTAYYPNGVQDVFPADQDLQKINAESYFGISLKGKTGKSLGHLCIVHDKALEDIERAQSLLTIFGARAAVELERMQAEHRVNQTLSQLRDLTRQLSLAQEQERKRIAQELHDEFGQSLTALNFDLTWTNKELAKESNEHRRQEISKKLQTMSGDVVDVINRIRQIASSLRPSILDDLGLVEALEVSLKEFQERTGILCDLRKFLKKPSQDFDEQTATAFYRITQEFLTNVMRHAKASHVAITLSQAGSDVVLELMDNGVGITEDQTNDPRSLGIVGMKERALSLGGRCTITGTSGKGTRVMVSISCERAC